MVRQPYSVAVLSTGGRLHPLVPEGREAWWERWSSPCRRDGEVGKTPSLLVKKVSVPCKGNRKGLKDYWRMILEPYASFTIFQRNRLLPMIYLLHTKKSKTAPMVPTWQWMFNSFQWEYVHFSCLGAVIPIQSKSGLAALMASMIALLSSLPSSSRIIKERRQPRYILPFWIPTYSRRSKPAKPGETFDGPTTIKRSGSEHRRAVFLFFPEGRRPRWEVEPSLTVRKDG